MAVNQLNPGMFSLAGIDLEAEQRALDQQQLNNDMAQASLTPNQLNNLMAIRAGRGLGQFINEVADPGSTARANGSALQRELMKAPPTAADGDNRAALRSMVDTLNRSGRIGAATALQKQLDDADLRAEGVAVRKKAAEDAAAAKARSLDIKEDQINVEAIKGLAASGTVTPGSFAKFLVSKNPEDLEFKEGEVKVVQDSRGSPLTVWFSKDGKATVLSRNTPRGLNISNSTFVAGPAEKKGDFWDDAKKFQEWQLGLDKQMEPLIAADSARQEAVNLYQQALNGNAAAAEKIRLIAASSGKHDGTMSKSQIDQMTKANDIINRTFDAISRGVTGQPLQRQLNNYMNMINLRSGIARQQIKDMLVRTHENLVASPTNGGRGLTPQEASVYMVKYKHYLEGVADYKTMGADDASITAGVAGDTRQTRFTNPKSGTVTIGQSPTNEVLNQRAASGQPPAPPIRVPIGNAPATAPKGAPARYGIGPDGQVRLLP